MLTALASAIGAILYRLRGGLWKLTTTPPGARWWNGTHACRAIWAAPTAGLMFWVFGGPLWLLGALALTAFLSMAFIGHGAHMVYGPAYWGIFQPGGPVKTELLTNHWLPELFGGLPDSTWGQAKTDLYNAVGMSFIGVVRNGLAVAPAFLFTPLGAAIYTATGLLHGPLYYAGWKLTPDIRAAECLVGAVSWATIGAMK